MFLSEISQLTLELKERFKSSSCDRLLQDIESVFSLNLAADARRRMRRTQIGIDQIVTYIAIICF